MALAPAKATSGVAPLVSPFGRRPEGHHTSAEKLFEQLPEIEALNGVRREGAETSWASVGLSEATQNAASGTSPIDKPQRSLDSYWVVDFAADAVAGQTVLIRE